jgi:hypothetical protein
MGGPVLRSGRKWPFGPPHEPPRRSGRIELTPTRLLRLSKDLPHDWSEQRHVLDFAA